MCSVYEAFLNGFAICSVMHLFSKCNHETLRYEKILAKIIKISFKSSLLVIFYLTYEVKKNTITITSCFEIQVNFSWFFLDVWPRLLLARNWQQTQTSIVYIGSFCMPIAFLQRAQGLGGSCAVFLTMTHV